MNREGVPTVLGLAAFTIMVGWLGLAFNFVNMTILAALGVVFTLFSIYFFRDPKRIPPDDASSIVSPADGKVIEVDVFHETEFIEGDAKRVVIFLSLFNVHVNYVPFAGIVDFIRFQRGTNVRANLPSAIQNVNILTGLKTARGKLAFRQSTGMVARRLVNHLRLGDAVKTGQKFGIIKFGSRMEVYLPTQAEIKVSVGDIVRAGESTIAEFHD